MSLQYWISDSEQEKELIFYLKRRDFEQKFVYFGEWARWYYQVFGQTDNVYREQPERLTYEHFFEKNVMPELTWKTFAFVSLWCWNAWQEKHILEDLCSKWVKFKYVGVDSSKEMLELAKKTLKWIEWLDADFIYADFTSSVFRNEVHSLISRYDCAFFALFGWTFGNLNQTSLTDSLYNVLRPWDLLRFDVLSRNENSQSVKLKLFDRYSGYLTNPEAAHLWFSYLRKVWMPFENGKIILETYDESFLGSMVFTFSFYVQKKTVIRYKGEVMYFLPNEKIKLLSIRNYQEEAIINFLHEHNFELVHYESGQINEWLKELQFLFKALPS